MFHFLMAYSPASIYQLSSVLVLLPAFALAQTSSKGTIEVNSYLTITDSDTPASWLSPGEHFAFGFRKVNENTDQFLLSIWYNKIPDRTIVWFRNDGNTVSRGSRVQLSADRGLVITDPKGKQLWNSGTLSDQVSHAFFNDAGNFQLLSSDSTKLWESFSYPTDTLLPTQIMQIDGVLYSRRSRTNFSRGRFQLRLLRDGNLVLNTREIFTNFAYKAYYISGTYDPSNTKNSGYQVLFDDSGHMHVLRRNGHRVDLTPSHILLTSEYYHRATLNFDGVFVQYYHPKKSTGTPNSWSPVWQQPENICLDIPRDLGSGACGYNSFCRLDVSGRPVCQCAPGYLLVDPDDMHGNCKPNFTLGCDDNNGQSSGEDLYELLEIKNANWPTSDYELLEPISYQDCKNSCLNDRFCAAVVYGSPRCWKKKLPLSFGRQASTERSIVLFKVKKGKRTSHSPKDSSRKKDHGTLILVGSVHSGSSVFFSFIIIGASCLGFLGIYLKNPLKAGPPNNIVENMRSFTYKELSEATKGFTEELVREGNRAVVPRGAFGIVYKGDIQMSTSKTLIAVRKLDRVTQETDKKFKTEVDANALTRHKNLVRLVGFCEEGKNRLLVYEYMVKGSLSRFLFGEVKPSWSQRIHIALGIARGLAYLHEECNTQIIHCDIKPQSILLDEYYNAQISDFRSAKLMMINQSTTKTAIPGTKGYVAPEWFRSTAPITVKVDVYSFGVMLLEIICCRKNVEDFENGSEGDVLTDWVWDCFREGRLDAVVKKDEEVGLTEWEEVERFVMVGIWCIQEDPSLRPTMRKVTLMLERVVDVPKPPCPF